MTRIYIIHHLHLRLHSLACALLSLFSSPLILKAQPDNTDQPVF
jgi:hypothetical protein